MSSPETQSIADSPEPSDIFAALEAGLDTAYSVPFDWGNVQVTKEAVNAYGLELESASSAAAGAYDFMNIRNQGLTTKIKVAAPTELHLARVRSGFMPEYYDAEPDFITYFPYARGVSIIMSLGTLPAAQIESPANRIATMLEETGPDIEQQISNSLRSHYREYAKSRMFELALFTGGISLTDTIAAEGPHSGIMMAVSAGIGLQWGRVTAVRRILKVSRADLPQKLGAEGDKSYGEVMADDVRKTFKTDR